MADRSDHGKDTRTGVWGMLKKAPGTVGATEMVVKVAVPGDAPQTDRAEKRERAVTVAQVAAARLRMTTDRRLGKATPDWIREIANAS